MIDEYFASSTYRDIEYSDEYIWLTEKLRDILDNEVFLECEEILNKLLVDRSVYAFVAGAAAVE